jgi:hypothetical protein
MMKPIVHMNGTSRNELIDGYITAMVAVEAAIDAIIKHAAPNGRDYYPISPSAYSEAHHEHQARLKALNAVALELNELAMHCSGRQSKAEP